MLWVLDALVMVYKREEVSSPFTQLSPLKFLLE